jgi:hypothetical protein
MDFDQLPRIHDSTGTRIACGKISLDAMTPTTTQLIDAACWAVGPVGYGWIWGVPTHGWFISWKIRQIHMDDFKGMERLVKWMVYFMENPKI